MRRLTRVFVAFALVLVAVPVTAAPGLAETGSAPIYLALGDSWAYGQGATDPATGGYVAQLYGSLKVELDCIPAEPEQVPDGCKHLQLVNLGRPGTAAMPGVTAPLVKAEQLPVAEALLTRNHDDNPVNDVEVITLHVGGNDVVGPILAACIGGFSPECQQVFVAEMTALQADLAEVVGALRAAAGPDTPIVIGTYDNPVPFCDLNGIPGAALLGEFVLEGIPGTGISGVNDIVRGVAAAFGAEVAEVFGDLDVAGDWLGGADCLHPADTGYDEVTDAFEEALGF
ncbi:MAG TPA: SGNH/GDSL hydrolase family protein [Acidimicrobiia bacterium]|nr:SGNH/GDSL hydrolase family protein [Acidimicrobiia bacterium]